MAGDGDDDVVPRVAVKSHLDGDPRPRPQEIVAFNATRVAHGLDAFLVAIALPNPDAGEPLHGYDVHWWEIGERDGKLYCDPSDVSVEVVDELDG